MDKIKRSRTDNLLDCQCWGVWHHQQQCHRLKFPLVCHLLSPVQQSTETIVWVRRTQDKESRRKNYIAANLYLQMYVSLFIIQVLKLERLFVVTDSCRGGERIRITLQETLSNLYLVKQVKITSHNNHKNHSKCNASSIIPSFFDTLSITIYKTTVKL